MSKTLCIIKGLAALSLAPNAGCVMFPALSLVPPLSAIRLDPGEWGPPEHVLVTAWYQSRELQSGQGRLFRVRVLQPDVFGDLHTPHEVSLGFAYLSLGVDGVVQTEPVRLVISHNGAHGAFNSYEGVPQPPELGEMPRLRRAGALYHAPDDPAPFRADYALGQLAASAVASNGRLVHAADARIISRFVDRYPELYSPLTRRLWRRLARIDAHGIDWRDRAQIEDMRATFDVAGQRPASDEPLFAQLSPREQRLTFPERFETPATPRIELEMEKRP